MRLLPFVSFLISFGLSTAELAADALKKPEIKQLNANEYQIGKVKLNKKTREITFGAGVNLVDRPLEYLLVNGKGKSLDLQRLFQRLGASLLGDVSYAA